MNKEIISTPNAPAAMGPYSQAIRVGDFLYVSGQVPVDPATGAFVRGAIEEQTEQVLKNLEAILTAAGTDMDHVVKTMVFISNMDEFARINSVYARYFTGNQPARSCVEAARLPKDVGVEIEAVAVMP